MADEEVEGQIEDHMQGRALKFEELFRPNTIACYSAVLMAQLHSATLNEATLLSFHPHLRCRSDTSQTLASSPTTNSALTTPESCARCESQIFVNMRNWLELANKSYQDVHAKPPATNVE